MIRQYVTRTRSDLKAITVAGSLGQVAPGAAVLTLAYTAPDTIRCSLTVVVTNRAATADAFRISVANKGAADTLAQYLAYDHPIEPNESLSTAPFQLGPGDAVRVYSTNGNLSFTVNGAEEQD